MRTIYTMNDEGLNIVCGYFDKTTDEWIDTVVAFEKLADDQKKTTLTLNGKEVTLDAEHFDEIRIAY